LFTAEANKATQFIQLCNMKCVWEVIGSDWCWSGWAY
jgi:hypothetical protein